MTAFAPSGFSLAKRQPSHNEYYVSASDSSTYAVGDPIATDGNFFVGRLPDSRIAQGMPHATAAVSGSRIRGVIVGVVPGPGGAEGTVIPASKTRSYVLLVDDNPLAVFSVQASNVLPITAGGMYANFVVGAPQGSVSGFRLDSGSLNTSTGDLLVLRVEENTGANSIAIVTFILREDAQIQAATPVGQVTDTASRAITSADNGKALTPTGAVTYTIPEGLNPMPSFTVDCPASGAVTIARSGATTINGGGASVARTRAGNPVGFVVLAHSEADAYGVSGA